MIKTATAINTFLPEQKDNFELPQEQQLITLSISDYKSIFIKIDTLTARIAALESYIDALKCRQNDDRETLALDIALDRQRLAKLERSEPQPLQKDRGEILRSLMIANGGKMLAKDARQKMHLSKELFSMLIASMGDYLEVKPLHSDKRKKVLVLK